eukprot:COSAG06_NODE_1073_length_10819_cov_4.311847_15_plen_70_part_00
MQRKPLYSGFLLRIIVLIHMTGQPGCPYPFLRTSASHCLTVPVLCRFLSRRRRQDYRYEHRVLVPMLQP